MKGVNKKTLGGWTGNYAGGNTSEWTRRDLFTRARTRLRQLHS